MVHAELRYVSETKSESFLNEWESKTKYFATGENHGAQAVLREAELRCGEAGETATVTVSVQVGHCEVLCQIVILSCVFAALLFPKKEFSWF